MADLSRAEWAALREHLATCANCRVVYAAYQAVDAQILRLPAVEPSAEQVLELRALVTGRAGRELRSRAGTPARERARERAPIPLAARISLLAVVVVVLLGGLYGLLAAHPLGKSPVLATRTTVPTPAAVPSHVIYAVSETGTVFAVNADTGKTIWSTALHVQVSKQFLVAGGKIFFGDTNDALYAVNASNGRLLWSYSYRSLMTAGNQTDSVEPYLVSDGKDVYFGTPKGIYAWDANGGQTLWEFPAPAGCEAQDGCAPSVMLVSNGVLYAYLDGLYALQASGGKKLWQAAQVPDGAPLVVAQNKVFVGGDGAPLRVFGAADGKLLETPDLAQVTPVDALMTNGSMVFVQSHNIGVGGFEVYGVRASDEKVLWLQGYYNGQGFAGVLGDSFFFTSISQDTFTQTTPVTDPTGESQQQYAGYLCSADMTDGSIQWCLLLMGNFTLQLEVLRDGTLYATTLGGVEAIRVSDGKQLWYALDSVTLVDIAFV